METGNKIPVCPVFYEITPKSTIIKDSIATLYTILYNLTDWNYSKTRPEEKNVKNKIIPMKGELYCITFTNVMCQLDLVSLQYIDSKVKPIQSIIKLLSKELQFHIGESRVLKRAKPQNIETMSDKVLKGIIPHTYYLTWRDRATKEQEQRQLILIKMLQDQFAVHFYEDIHLLQFTVDSSNDETFVLSVDGFERCDTVNINDFNRAFFKNVRTDDYKVTKIIFDLKHSAIVFHVDNVKRKNRNVIVQMVGSSIHDTEESLNKKMSF